MKPINDTILVELDNKKHGKYSLNNNDPCETGTLLAVSDKILFLSSFSFVLEDSLNHPSELEELRQYYQGLIGKKVRWEQRADIGTSFEKDGKKYAYIKITKLLGEAE